jgi:hypothetical protein
MLDYQGFVGFAEEWGFKGAVGPAILACLVGGGATVLKVFSRSLWWAGRKAHQGTVWLLSTPPPEPPPPLSVVSQSVVDVLTTKDVLWDPVKGELVAGNLVIHYVSGKLKSILADKKDILPRIKGLGEELRVEKVADSIIDHLNADLQQAEDRRLIESIRKH